MTVATDEIRVVLADDEAPARAQGAPAAGRGVRDARVVGEAANGAEAVRLIEQLAPDLVLLDVQMPQLDGFGVVATVGPRAMPPKSSSSLRTMSMPFGPSKCTLWISS